MSTEVSVGNETEPGPVTEEDLDLDAVAQQLQLVYNHLLNDRRPEAVASTERLADELNVDIARPDGFPRRARR